MAGPTRRLTGTTKAVAYAEDDGTEVVFVGSGVNFLKNAYNAGVQFQSDDVDVTAFGDYLYGIG